MKTIYQTAHWTFSKITTISSGLAEYFYERRMEYCQFNDESDESEPERVLNLADVFQDEDIPSDFKSIYIG